MYNDYYLQQIDSKLSVTNNYLTYIRSNQETLISGDNEIKQAIETNTMQCNVLLFVTMAILLYLFVVRCMKQ